METIRYYAPCPFGTEGILGSELRRLDAQNVTPSNGRVMFEGNLNMLARTNICSRYAERILICVGQFTAGSFEELFQGVKALPWERWISKSDRFPVKGWSLESALHSIPDCQSIIKKAVVDRLSEKYRLSWFEETDDLYQIQFAILKDEVTMLIDTSGPGLHKRGYRALSGGAPLKETLAAAIADLARARMAQRVFDPCCGSGTLLIESALSALGIAPGIKRDFTAGSWRAMDKGIWKIERERARASERSNAAFKAFGADIDSAATELTIKNASKAGVGDMIKTVCRSLSEFAADDDGGVVLCNPPYGERLMNTDEAVEIYKTMGRVFREKPGWSYYIISPDENFEHYIDRPARKRRKLYNGMIRCNLYMYY